MTDEIKPYYTVPETPDLIDSLRKLDQLKQEIDRERPLVEDVWETVQTKLRYEWTYHSNAIEGNTLTLGETIFFLQEGITVSGKPFKDFLEAHNHNEVLDLLFDVIKNNRPISEGLIKEINAMLLRGISSTPAVTQFGQKVKKPTHPGEYKKLPNHVLLSDGSIHYYVDPLQVPGEMQALVEWIDRNRTTVHPVIAAAVAHYNMVRIHPFDDGNGRGARILMNLILLKAGYPTAIIKIENRVNYLEALEKADHGTLEPFIRFVADALTETEEVIVTELRRGKEKQGL